MTLTAIIENHKMVGMLGKLRSFRQRSHKVKQWNNNECLQVALYPTN